MSTEISEIKNCVVNLDKKIDQMMNTINNLKEKHDDVAKDIARIKEAVYHPNDGLYARVREIETEVVKVNHVLMDIDKIKDPQNGLYVRVKEIQEWKTSFSRAAWLVMSTITALVIKQIWDLLG